VCVTTGLWRPLEAVRVHDPVAYRVPTCAIPRTSLPRIQYPCAIRSQGSPPLARTIAVSTSDNPLADRVRRLAEVAGGVGGAVVGLLLGGPTGAVVGAASGPVLAEATRKVVADVAGRFLSERETVRIANAAFYAASEIADRLERQEQLRTDAFFELRNDGRSDAEEIFEGVLLKCKNEHEERKAQYLGHLFANIAFSNVSAANANAILKLAERMSYRQLCVLALCVQEEEFKFDNMDFLRLRQSRNDDASYLFAEWRELRSEGIGVVEPENACEGPTIRPTELGHSCYRLMGLSKIARDEIARLAETVRGAKR
jgi:hypothetical protein